MSKLDKLVGQDEAKRVMVRFAWNAKNHPNEVIDSLCFIGPASSGKTICARATAEDAGIPLLELQPQAIRKPSDLVDAARKFRIDCDRIAIFIDEIHQANMQLEQCLLKALEPNDRLLIDERGWELSTRKFVFMFATTDRGDLFDALDTRTVKVNLRLYSRSEVAQIVQLNYPKWSLKACELVAKFCGSIPREALAFARDMEIERKMTGESSATKLAEIVRQDHRIDEHGLTQQRLDILIALGQAPISRNRLGSIAQCKDAELQKFILPALLAKTPDREQPLITVSSKGYTITPEGLKELNLRGIPNQGIEAIPKSVRCLFPLNDPEEQPQAADSRPLSVPFKRNA